MEFTACILQESEHYIFDSTDLFNPCIREKKGKWDEIVFKERKIYLLVEDEKKWERKELSSTPSICCTVLFFCTIFTSVSEPMRENEEKIVDLRV